MTWQLVSWEILPRTFSDDEKQRFDQATQDRLAKLQFGVRFTLDDFDTNGVASGKPVVYIEPVVTRTQLEDLGKIAGDQCDQLNKVAALTKGPRPASELTPFMMSRVPVQPTDEELAIASFNAKRAQLGDMRALVSEGILDENDPDFVALFDEVKRDFAAIRAAAAAATNAKSLAP